MKKNKPSLFKRLESKLNNFIDGYTSESMRYLVIFFIFLLLATVNIDNKPARIFTSILFIIFLSVIICTKIIRKRTSISTSIVSPYWAMVGKEINIDIKVKIEKGFLGLWYIKIINKRSLEDVEKEKQYKFWFLNPNAKKELKRWILKNPQVYLNRENEPVVFEDQTIFVNEFNNEINIKMKGFVKKRGVQKISNIMAGKKDIFNLTQAIIDTNLEKENIIYCIPNPREITKWPSYKAQQSLINNKNKQKKKKIIEPSGDNFFGLKEARREDPLKNTHWKTLAKTGKRFIIEKETELPIKTSLLIDPVLSDSKYAEERFEQMLEMVVGQALNTSHSKNIDWLLLDQFPLSLDNKKHWNDIYKKISILKPLKEEELKQMWENLEDYWKKVIALRIITTREENELAEWINLWKSYGIFIEIIKVPFINEGEK